MNPKYSKTFSTDKATLRAFIKESLLAEMKKYVGINPPEVLKKLNDRLLGKTLIFLDTETTGFQPSQYKTGTKQITEIAGIAVPLTSWQNVPDVDALDKVHFKVKLSPSVQARLAKIQAKNLERQQRGLPPLKEKDPITKEKEPDFDPLEDILTMTGYFQQIPSVLVIDEANAMRQFAAFVDKYPGAILVAHNAEFDMRFINVRSRACGVKQLKNEVMDTLMFYRTILRPSLEGVKRLLDGFKINREVLQKKSKTSMALGRVIELFDIPLGLEHRADEDVKMTIKSLYRIFNFLNVFYKSYTDLIQQADPEKQQQLHDIYAAILADVSEEQMSSAYKDRELRNLDPNISGPAAIDKYLAMVSDREKRRIARKQRPEYAKQLAKAEQERGRERAQLRALEREKLKK